MRVLVTSSRNPFALDVVRKLADQRHEVYASDTYRAAAGSHSRYLTGHFVTSSPRYETEKFIGEVTGIVSDHGIEMIVPTFEEAFYLATRHAELSALTMLYTGRFDQLARLHDKASFQQLAHEFGVRAPETAIATDDDELRSAIGRFPRYFARAAFSRGGVALLTNTGPLAGHVDPGSVHPRADQPWLVQEFVDGPMVCTYSTVHDGRVTAHCTYRAPRQWEHSTGIQFLSVDGGPSLELVQRIAGGLRYTGQLSFDFVEGDAGLFIIECNPRTTDGALLMSPPQLAGGITDPRQELAMVEPGQLVQLDFAVFAQLFKDGLKAAPKTIHDLVHLPDAGHGWHDHLPALWSFASLARGARLSRREHEQILEAMAEDIVWNGEPIAGMSTADARALDEVHAGRR